MFQFNRPHYNGSLNGCLTLDVMEESGGQFSRPMEPSIHLLSVHQVLYLSVRVLQYYTCPIIAREVGSSLTEQCFSWSLLIRAPKNIATS